MYSMCECIVPLIGGVLLYAIRTVARPPEIETVCTSRG